MAIWFFLYLDVCCFHCVYESYVLIIRINNLKNEHFQQKNWYFYFQKGWESAKSASGILSTLFQVEITIQLAVCLFFVLILFL